MPSAMTHSATYQQLRLPHPTELDLDLAGMQQTTHFNHPSSSSGVNNDITSPITIHTANSMAATPTVSVLGQSSMNGSGNVNPHHHQVEGPICSSSPKRSMSAFTTFGPQGPRSNASTPLSPSALGSVATGMNGHYHHTNGSGSVSSNSATPSPQVMTSPMQQRQHQQRLVNKSSISNGNHPVPTTGHLV